MRVLLLAGADATLPFCWKPDAADAPIDGRDIAMYSAYQLAFRRGWTSVCALLAEHGASQGNHPDSECPICYDELYDQDGAVTKTPCGHRFHTACLGGWLKHSRSKCPICRVSLTVSDES